MIFKTRIVSKNSKELLDFYQKNFDAKKLSFFSGKDMGMPGPNAENICVHAEFKLFGNHFAISDQFDWEGEKTPLQNIAAILDFKDKKELQALWDKFVKLGSKVIMPLGKQDWSSLYGNLLDKFGNAWEFNLDSN